MSGKPSKKDFADLINSVMGQDVMNERKLDRILNEAKKAQATKGTDGLFDYLRDITNAPVNNDQIRDIADTVRNSGGPDQALDSLKRQKMLNNRQATQIDKTIRSKNPKKNRNRRSR